MAHSELFSKSQTPPGASSPTGSSHSNAMTDSSENIKTDRDSFSAPLLVSDEARPLALPIRSRRSTIEPEVVRASDTIYHIKRTAARHAYELRPGIYEFDIVESFTDYFSAVRSAYNQPLLGIPNHHSTFAVPWRQEDHTAEEWPWGLSCLIRAEADNGDVYTVEIELEDGKSGTLGDEEGRVYWPLFFVMVAEIYHGEEEEKKNLDQKSSSRGSSAPWKYRSSIHSSWTTPKSARALAQEVLLEGDTTRKDFLWYDVYSQKRRSKWGENIVVHAVGIDETNTFVALMKSSGDDEGEVVREDF